MKIDIMAEFPELAKRMQKISAAGQEKVKDAILKSTLQIEAQAKLLAPAKTGKLRGSIQSRVFNDGLSGEVTATAAHAAFVEFNTRAHIIRPKRKKWLRFKKGGEWVFRKVVFHPGTTEQPFMRPALEQERPHLLRELNDIVGGDRS